MAKPNDRRLGVVLKRAEQAMVRAKSAALRAVGLTLPQYVALRELERQPGITAASLARATQVTPQSMMVVLKSLEEHGLIERSPHPRHANVLEVRVTAAGGEALAAGRGKVEPVERRILRAFSAQEQAQLDDLLTRWIEAIEGP